MSFVSKIFGGAPKAPAPVALPEPPAPPPVPKAPEPVPVTKADISAISTPAPVVIAVPPVPQPSPIPQEQDASVQMDKMKEARRRKLAAMANDTILTSAKGDTSTPVTATKKLLGA